MTARRTLVLLAGLLVALAALPSLASARRVSNPRTFSAEVTSGYLRITNPSKGTDTQIDLGTLSPHVTLTGPIDGAGNITIPKTQASSPGQSGVFFPKVSLDTSQGTVTLTVIPTNDWTGHINPMTGATDLRMRFKVHIQGPVDCYLASDSNPLDFNTATSGTSGSMTGIGYNASSGTVRLVNNTSAVSSSQDANGCSKYGINVDSQVNDALGLPNSAGNNYLQMDLKFTPVVSPAVNASFTTTLAPTSGIIPATATFNAGASSATAGIKNYKWDFDGNGTFDQTTTTPTTTHVYDTPGTYAAKLRVTDVENSDNDYAETTRNVVIKPKQPDMSMTLTHPGNFRIGADGTYTVTVTNADGAGATQGPVTVTTQLPAGLTYKSKSGSGWTCSTLQTAVTCSNPFTTPLQPGSSSSYTITVTPTLAALGDTVATALVQTTPEADPSDDTASDPTTTEAIDLALTASHVGAFQVSQSDSDTRLYTLDVTNEGAAATVGTITLTDDLPAGMTFYSATGDKWSCPAPVGQHIVCTRNEPIAGGATSTVKVRVLVTDANTYTNTGSVSTQDDIDSSNNSASDPTGVFASPDLSATLSHSPDAFQAGHAGSYSLLVRNDGVRDAAGSASATITMPTGMTVSSASGSGWTCTFADASATCTSIGISLTPGQSLPAIAVGVNVDYQAAPEAGPTALITYTPTSGDADPNQANDTATDATTVNEINVAIANAHADAFRVNDHGHYTLSVSNTGSLPTTGDVTVSDHLPTGLTYVDATGTDWTCSATGQDVTCTRSKPLAAHAAAPDIDLEVAIDSAAAGTVSNTATVTTPDDSRSADNSSTDTTVATQVDLNVAQSHVDGPWRVGTQRTYVLQVRNGGSVASTGTTTLHDDLPDGTTLVSATGNGWTCTNDASSIDCSYPAVVAPQSSMPPVSMRVAIGADAVPELVNAFSAATPGDTNLADNSSTDDPVEVVGPDAVAAIDGPDAVRAGGTADYVLSVHNAGTAPTYSDVTVTDTLPSGLAPLSASGQGWDCRISGQTVTCTRGGSVDTDGDTPDIALHASVATPASGPTLTNAMRASVSGDIDTTNDTASATSDIGEVDLAMNVLANASSVPQNGRTTVDLGVRNVGAVDTDVPLHVSLTMPAGLSLADVDASGWSCDSNATQLDCVRDATVAAGDVAPTITLGVIGSQPGNFSVSATARTNDDGHTGNDAASAPLSVVAAPDLGVTVQPAGGADATLRPGSNSSYVVTVRNAGSAPTTSNSATKILVLLPVGTTLSGAVAPNWTCTGPDTSVTCTRKASAPALQPGDREDVRLTVAVTSAAAPAATFSASVTTPGDANAGNNSDSDADREVDAADLAISTRHAGELRAADTGRLSISVHNAGTADTTGPVSVADYVPTGMRVRSAAGEGWTCVVGQIVRCHTDATVPAGGDVPDISVEVAVDRDAASSLTNVVALTSNDDFNRSNDSASDAIPVAPASAETFKLTLDGGTLAAGGLPAIDLGPSAAADPLVISGTLGSDGTLTSTKEGFYSPFIALPNGLPFKARLVPVDGVSGHLDRSSGQLSITVKVRLLVIGDPAPDGCGIGSDSDPVVLQLTTGTSGPGTGSPINSGNGALTLVDDTFGVPAAAGCGDLGDSLNSGLGLPTAGGSSKIALTGRYQGPAAGTSAPAPSSGGTTTTTPSQTVVETNEAPTLPAPLTLPVTKKPMHVVLVLPGSGKFSARLLLHIGGKTFTLPATKGATKKGNAAAVLVTLPPKIRAAVLKALKAGKKVTLELSVKIKGKTVKRTVVLTRAR